MIVGIGVDLVDIARFERSIERTPKLLDRLFTAQEQTLKPHSLAARYAAKEALIKALGGSDGVHWTDIEIGSEPSGRPVFALSGTTHATVAARGITAMHLSLSHDAGLATAYVIAEAASGPGSAHDPAQRIRDSRAEGMSSVTAYALEAGAEADALLEGVVGAATGAVDAEVGGAFGDQADVEVPLPAEPEVGGAFGDQADVEAPTDGTQP